MIAPLQKKLGLLIGALGLCLCVFSFTFGLGWDVMQKSDCLSGLLLLGFGVLLVYSDRLIWVIGVLLLGIWLELSPLVFWASSPLTYANDGCLGLVVLLLAFHLPSLSKEEEMIEEEIPPGWSFNPSAWLPRLLTVTLALCAFFLSRYLASYQLGYIHEMFDPFFGEGTVKVITSPLSKRFPVPDAGLGAFGYLMEFVLGIVGSSRRWKTMPWLTVFFGLLVVPAGMISLLLVISQPLVVGAWCGICLLIALCMLVMIVLTAPEMVAVFQMLNKARKAEESVWNVFWRGSQNPSFLVHEKKVSLGISFPWTLLSSFFCGLALVLFPSFLELEHQAADSSYALGLLVMAFSFIACSEPLRVLRLLNMVWGVGILLSALFLGELTSFGGVFIGLLGLLIAALAIPRGHIYEKYGEK